MNIKIIIFWSLLFISNVSFAQENGFVVPDSLKGKSFGELKNAFYDNFENIPVANIYVKSYLKKAKNINNTDTIALAYYYLSRINLNQKREYLDSIIFLKYSTVNKFFPAKAYLDKGFIISNYNTKKALDYYIKGLNISKKSKNTDLQNDFVYNIALLKSLIGDNKAALSMFKKCYAFNIENHFKKKKNYKFLATVFGLADSYHRNNYLDSASYYNRLGAEEAFKNKNKIFKAYFILNEGANHYVGNKYNIAIDSIQKSIPMLKNDNYNLGIAYFYLGESYYKLNKKKKAIQKLLKMDSLITLTNYIMPEERTGYETLIQYYKEKADLKKQLFYTDRLIKSDSLLKSYHQNLSKNLALKFDIPQLVQDKNLLISKMEKKSNRQYYYILGLLILVLIAIPILIVNYKARIQLKKRFDILLNSLEQPKEVIKKGKKIDLADGIIDKVLNQLQNFEDNNLFLELGITQSKLAKQFNTNSSYLSKIINHYKNQSFSNYLNELRIDYALKTLKNDKKIRKYTIKAIAEEFGFSNSESFSKAFYKKTGIKPSYFIKQIEKQPN